MKTTVGRMKASVRVSISLLTLATMCVAQEKGSGVMPGPSAEAKRTANSISGDWSGRMTASFPGAKSESFPWEVKCSPAALGFGAACTLAGKASIGPIAESCLLAYDPERKEVHYMCVTSSGEVHDHQGQWIDDRTIELVAYKASMMADKVVETVRLSFPDAKTLQTKSIITTENGATMTFTFVGQRK
ncbi:MAG TPA: hypothetical protein VEZ90_18490 [Blastocatellia bacterium]|nr:hypothetical protein [Blastocatellia bacterium]